MSEETKIPSSRREVVTGGPLEASRKSRSRHSAKRKAPNDENLGPETCEKMVQVGGGGDQFPSPFKKANLAEFGKESAHNRKTAVSEKTDEIRMREEKVAILRKSSPQKERSAAQQPPTEEVYACESSSDAQVQTDCHETACRPNPTLDDSETTDDFLPSDPDHPNTSPGFDRLRKFPEKLWDVVNAGSDVIKWSADGLAVEVDENLFAEKVATDHPGLVQIPSFINFRRQLREYGFNWGILKKHLYYFKHEYFQRDRPHFLTHVKTRRHTRRSIGEERRIRQSTKIPDVIGADREEDVVAKGLDANRRFIAQRNDWPNHSLTGPKAMPMHAQQTSAFRGPPTSDGSDLSMSNMYQSYGYYPYGPSQSMSNVSSNDANSEGDMNSNNCNNQGQEGSDYDNQQVCMPHGGYNVLPHGYCPPMCPMGPYQSNQPPMWGYWPHPHAQNMFPPPPKVNGAQVQNNSTIAVEKEATEDMRTSSQGSHRSAGATAIVIKTYDASDVSQLPTALTENAEDFKGVAVENTITVIDSPQEYVVHEGQAIVIDTQGHATE